MGRKAHDSDLLVNLFRGRSAMIDFASLLLAHGLLFLIALRIFNNPDLNVEPVATGRRFKTVGPRA
jgi:hypothetical protein